MYIRRLCLAHFRNYELLEIRPSPGLNVLVGENGHGKSNLLEAIYMLATTKSFRATRDTDVIQKGNPDAVAFAEVVFDDGPSCDVELTVSREDRKSARINGARADRVLDLLGMLNAVFFGALDLRLINGEPSARRRYMDLAIAQTSPKYGRDLAAFRRSLDQRNSVLREMRDNPEYDPGLDVWTDQMTTHGSAVMERRFAFTDELAKLAVKAYAELSGKREKLVVRYEPSLGVEPEPPLPLEKTGGVSTVYLAVRVCYDIELARVREIEIRRGTSLIGPHRDDLRLSVDGMEARAFASQGQQRTVVLSLKLAEFEYLEQCVGRSPVMLLDDVMSDLDDDRRSRLLQRVRGKCQTFITCTNLRSFPQEVLSEATVFVVRDGAIETVTS